MEHGRSELRARYYREQLAAAGRAAAALRSSLEDLRELFEAVFRRAPLLLDAVERAWKDDRYPGAAGE
jgi:hypothetical protein